MSFRAMLLLVIKWGGLEKKIWLLLRLELLIKLLKSRVVAKQKVS